MPERYVGRQLGRFRIDAPVGAGGFSWVYKGWDDELDIPVAIKILKPQFAGDDAFETRFRREALTASHLRHPNIIRILGVGKQDGAVYFAMDFLPHNLTERLRAMQVIPEPMLARIGADVADALAFAHREGVIHRDIKLDNILFDDHGNAIVADFGIARASAMASEETATNMVVGTPQYFSPEQARGQPLDGRSDIYSLGVTLYRAGTGVLPFVGSDWYEIARQQIEDTPKPPRTLNPLLSTELESIVLRCLEKRPDKRYSSADVLRDDLASLAAREASEPTAEIIAVKDARRTAGRLAFGKYRIAAVGVVAAVALLATSPIRQRKANPIPAKQPAAAPPTDTTIAQGSTAPRMSPMPAPPLLTAPHESAATQAATPRPPDLRVTATSGAQITVADKLVGRGEFHTTTMPAGTYWVVASVSSIPGCTTSRDSEHVQIAAGRVSTVHLTPRPCGLLLISATPDGARFSIGVAGEPPLATGATPMPGPIMLPVGNYQLHAASPRCANYDADVEIDAGDTRTLRFVMMCGQE